MQGNKVESTEDKLSPMSKKLYENLSEERKLLYWTAEGYALIGKDLFHGRYLIQTYFSQALICVKDEKAEIDGFDF